jgi:urease accessory protein
VHVDWLSSGRRARGERWAFDACRTSLRVRRDRKWLCYDALTLAAGDGALGDRLGRFDSMATVVIVGPRFQNAAAALVARSAAETVARRSDRLFMASPLSTGDGCLMRMASVSLEDAACALRQALDFLPLALGDDPWARKW